MFRVHCPLALEALLCRPYLVSPPDAGGHIRVFSLNRIGQHLTHPNGTRADYGCVTYTASVEVLGEFSAEIEPVLARVPAVVRPSTDTIVGWLPECDAAE